MACKVQIKPIKNNPLSAKLKAKKKALKTHNLPSFKTNANKNQ
jgi:hypothetical protein